MNKILIAICFLAIDVSMAFASPFHIDQQSLFLPEEQLRILMKPKALWFGWGKQEIDDFYRPSEIHGLNYETELANWKLGLSYMGSSFHRSRSIQGEIWLNRQIYRGLRAGIRFEPKSPNYWPSAGGILSIESPNGSEIALGASRGFRRQSVSSENPCFEISYPGFPRKWSVSGLFQEWSWLSAVVRGSISDGFDLKSRLGNQVPGCGSSDPTHETWRRLDVRWEGAWALKIGPIHASYAFGFEREFVERTEYPRIYSYNDWRYQLRRFRDSLVIRFAQGNFHPYIGQKYGLKLVDNSFDVLTGRSGDTYQEWVFGGLEANILKPLLLGFEYSFEIWDARQQYQGIVGIQTPDVSVRLTVGTMERLSGSFSTVATLSWVQGL